MKKRFISLALAFVIAVSIPLGALAAVTAPALRFSHSSPFAVAAARDRLTFTLPSDSDFAYLRISLTDRNEIEYNLEWTKRESDNTVSYSLSGVENGTYFVQIFISPVQFGAYRSYVIGRLIKVVISENSVYFELARTYEANKLIFDSKRADGTALLHYLEPSEGVQSGHRSITALAESIVKDIRGDFERARAIHDWVCDNIWYDEDVLYKRAPYGEQSALSTLNSKRGVCLGFANLTAALLRAAGIPAKVVTGYALGVGGEDDEWTNESASGRLPANHAWNEFYANGRWVITDPTWNTSNSYSRGRYSQDTGLYGYYYFDMTLESFSADHLIYDYSEAHIPAHAEPKPAASGTAAPNRSKVMVNDREVMFEAYTINSENYFKLRDVMYAINGTSKQFHAVYDSGAIALLSRTPYVPDGTEMRQGDGTSKSFITNAASIYKDGNEITLTAYTIGGNNFFRMRDIAREFNIFVAFTDGVIIIDTARDYVAP
ncbi:MAG: transglutaminase-like domain-containing protein [Oscillospiraceae bacterium]|nr:transglutaminase-like domain-containing protein [Oscillospiraceae bacterium]